MTPPRPEPVDPAGPDMAAYIKGHYERETARSQQFRCQTWYADRQIQAQCILWPDHTGDHCDYQLKRWSDFD